MSSSESSKPRIVGDWSHMPAERLTDPKSGASKGMRVTRLDLIPPEAMLEISAVYGLGERKYPAGPAGPNWLVGDPDLPGQGMPWSWNLRALKQHIAEFEMGIDFDPEDGVHALAHAAWHILALLTYAAREIGTDDRPFKRES